MDERNNRFWDVTVIVQHVNDYKAEVTLRIPAWSLTQEVGIQLSKFPRELQEQFCKDFRFRAKVNIDAKKENLIIKDFLGEFNLTKI